MFRNGYTNIVPFGRTRDRGRDAQVSLYRGNHAQMVHKVFFQYSLEKKWESKLKREIQKVQTYDQQIGTFVFVTTQNVSGDKRDKLEYQFSQEYDCELLIFDREWLRLQLEEANRDLAQKYLGLPGDWTFIDPREATKPLVPSKEQLEEAWELFVTGDYEQALPNLKKLLGKGFDTDVWRYIAWCYYILVNYKEALRAIENSLALKSDSKESLSIKGCILAESGISEKSRTKLALSKEIFERLANQDDSWVIYYNLGNVLSGLEEYPEAKKSYLRAIDNNSEIAEVWSNFGRCLHHLKEHEQELSCFDKAISLNPGLSQAFVSKAVTLGKVYEKYKAAIEILDFTLERDPNVERGFPFFWSWRTQFLLELDDIHSAFDSVETGLVNFPDEHSLLEMKSFILSNLWSKESAYLERAEVFFKMRAYSNLNDYRPFIELAKISIEKNNLDISLEYIRQALNILSPMQEISIETLKLLRFSIENLINSIAHVSIYQGFRKSSSVSVPYFFEGLDEILICIYKLSWICFFVSFNDLFHFFIEALKPDFEQKGEIEAITQ
jgi:tetratricopeptide (TPR) repeat protein